MKITMYELLGMVKDGKAPKKIKYREMIYHICYEYGDYESDIEEYRFADTKEHYYLFESIDMLKCLNDEVEILEEEKKIPEKLPYYSLEKIQKAKNKDEWHEERMSLLEKRVEDLHIKMNEIIDTLEMLNDKIK